MHKIIYCILKKGKGITKQMISKYNKKIDYLKIGKGNNLCLIKNKS